MEPVHFLSRRRLLQGTATATFSGLLPRHARAKTTTVGFIYVGSRDDYGYNQAHAQGAAALKKMRGIKVVEEEKVPETDAVEKTMESMINLDGAITVVPDLLWVLQPACPENGGQISEGPLRTLRRAVDRQGSGKTPQLFRLYRRSSVCQRHRRRPHDARSGKLGFVAAKPIPQVLRNINAFTLGARLANPKVTMQVIFTGDWSMPVKEAEATNSLIDQGVDVSPAMSMAPRPWWKMPRAAAPWSAAIMSTRRSSLPKAYLTGAEWNWEALYPRFVKMFIAGETIPNFYRGGLKERLVKVSPYGSMVNAAARKQADDVKAKLAAGRYVIFKGPIVDNKGKTVIAAGVERGQTDPELEKMDYLVEGVNGATS